MSNHKSDCENVQLEILGSDDPYLEELQQDDHQIVDDDVDREIAELERQRDESFSSSSRFSSDERLENIAQVEKMEVKRRYNFTNEYLEVGAFGKVIKAFDMDEGGKEVAVKTIDTYMKRPTIANEVKFLRSQNHPNVVKMLDHFISDGYLCIVIDIALGNLEDLIRRTNGIKEELCCFVIEQILKGMSHIHKQKIVHRNLCPKNILIYPESVIKISDFGNACRMIGGKARGFKGVVNYMAPEVILQWEDGRGADVRYNETTDIWAIGSILMETAQGIKPYLGLSAEELRLKIMTRNYRPPRLNPLTHNYSNQLHEFLNNMVEIKPINRWTASQLLAHNWIAEHEPEKEESAKEIMRLLTGLDIPVGIEVRQGFVPSVTPPIPLEAQPVKCKYDWSWITKLCTNCCGKTAPESDEPAATNNN